MDQNILNEINQMKFMFGYKPGLVISEQVELPKSETNPVNAMPDARKIEELEATISVATRSLDAIKNQKDDQSKKEQISDLQTRLDDTVNKIITPEFNKMSKEQQKVLMGVKTQIDTELNKLKGIEVSAPTQARTPDAKVSAWVTVAASLLALCTNAIEKFKKPQQ
jgi:hypothetical protein